MFRNIRHKVPVIWCYFCNHNGTGKIRSFYVTIFLLPKGTPYIYRHFHCGLRIFTYPFQQCGNVEIKYAVAVNLISSLR